MKIDQTKQIATKSLVLLWAILCIATFIGFPSKISYIHWTNLDDWHFLASKLERIELTDYGIDLLRAFVGIVLFSCACTSLGASIIRLLKLGTVQNQPTMLARHALAGTAFLVGHGFFSLVFLTLGGIYKLTPTYVIPILVIGLLSGPGELKKIFSTPLRNAKFIETANNKRDRLILSLSISILLFTILYSAARISYDSSAIYFSDAKLTALTNHVQYFRDDTFVISAFQTVIQYAALIQIFGDQSARLLSWISGIILIIFSVALGERVGLSKRARLILLALLLTSTAFLDLMGDGKVDLISSAPALAAIYWISVADQNGIYKKFTFILIGFLIGLAMIARPFNIFLIGIFVGLYFSHQAFFQNGFRPSNYKQFMSSLFWIGIGANGLGIYHLFANWLILGDPLAFLSNVSKINPSTGPWYFDSKQIFVTRLLYPLTVTFLNNPQSLGNISPMFVAFLPAALVYEIRKRINVSKELKNLMVISTITLVLWILSFFTVVEIRYVIFLWAILFMPLAEIIASALENEDHFFQSILSGLIILLLIYNIWRTIYISINTYSPLDKQGNPQCYDSRFCQFLRPVNKVAAPGDRIFTLNAFRYYLRTDLFACSTKHEEYRALQELSHKDSVAFWSEVYRQGYKYITYENDYTIRHLQFGLIPDPDNVPDWIKLDPIYDSPGDLQIAYRIQATNPPIKVESICEKNSSGIWEVHSISQ